MHIDNNKRRSLPPGVDQIDDDVIFGKMWIKVGTLKLIRTSGASYQALCQFWGEETPAILEIRSDLRHNEERRIQHYDIKCPAPYFKEYLNEMKNNFRFDVEGVGKVTFDISKFLKAQVQIDSKHVFDHFKGFFQVIGRGGRKAGSLQVEMGCEFDSELALKQIGNNESLKMQSAKKKAPVQQSPNKQKKSPIIEDKRIAHSLNNKQAEESQFRAQKYQEIIKEDEEKKINPQGPKEYKDQSQQFPQIPKVLTYSNLRLNPKQNQVSNINITENQDEDPVLQQLKEEKQNIEKQENISKKEIEQQKFIGESLQEAQKIEIKPRITKDELFRQFYGTTPKQSLKKEKSIIDEIKEKGHEKEIEESQAILSRVINLDNELKKGEKKSIQPPILQYQAKVENINEKTFNYPFSQSKKKRSSLLLNLLVQIKSNTLIVPTKNKILLIHRPYGQKERVKLGPDFTDIVTILCPVGEAQLKKMDKIPFIIECWDAYENNFLGMIKLNLLKIKKGFILNGQLNEMAIKTNLLPTIIEKGKFPILNISGNRIGSCILCAAIGTSAQLDCHLNQTNQRFDLIPQPDINSPEKANKQIENQNQQQKQESQEQVDDELEQLDKILDILDEKSSSFIDNLMHLVNAKTVPKEELEGFFKKISPYPKTLSNLFLYTSGSQINANFSHISDSFNDFKDTKKKLQQIYDCKVKKMKQNTNNLSQLISEIKKKSSFNIIQKKQLRLILNQNFIQMQHEGFFDLLNNTINTDILIAGLEGKNGYRNPNISLNNQYFPRIMGKNIIDSLRKKNINSDQILEYFKMEPTVEATSLWKFFNENQILISFWHIFHVFKIIKKKSTRSIQLVHLFSWLQSEENKVDEEKRNQDNKKNIYQQKKEIQRKEPARFEESQSDVKSIKQRNQEKENQQNNISPQKEDRSQIASQKKKKEVSGKKEEDKVYKHLFSIEAIELFLQKPDKGSYFVSYNFPFEQEDVNSKQFLGFEDKHKYNLKLYGTHGFSIVEDVTNYLGENVIKFYVKINGIIEHEGALHADEFVINENSQDIKVIPLFSDSSESTSGKIRLRITYQKILSKDHTLGKETTYQLFLPKSGYMNYNLTTEIDMIKLKSQVSLNEQFYIALIFDPFYQNPNLKTHFPPVSTKLTSSSSALHLSGSMKMTLSTPTLNHIRTNSARIILSLIYYSKEKGNFERKEIPYGIVDIPLINLIKKQGIAGDYAFKNKYGMFVSLINCEMKYEKEMKAEKVDQKINEKKRQKTWILLQFIQLLNFQPYAINWIKFQFIFKGKKYSSQKHNLAREQIHNLKNSSILLELPEQQLHEMKVLPLSILTNLSEKLAIDINVKQISKNLIRDKYFVHNQYFLVINQSSEALKMRVAIKTHAFRGSQMVGNFVSSLSHNLGTEMFEQMELPKQISNYKKMLEIYRKNLKLSAKTFNDCLQEILTTSNDKLSFELFTTHPQYKLNFTPIVSDPDNQIQSICEQLSTQSSVEQIIQFIKRNGIKLKNFRQQFLERFRFQQLNRGKLDKNVQFLGLVDEVDVIAFLRKIQLVNRQGSYEYQREDEPVRELCISEIKGNDFHLLYNGIKPNAVLKIPELEFATEIVTRSSVPCFQKEFRENIDIESLKQISELKIEVYHAPAEKNEQEDILIGQGTLSLSSLEARVPSTRIMRLWTHSLMSGRLKALIQMKISLGWPNQQQSNIQEPINESFSRSKQASRIGEILQQINHQMSYKKDLFLDSSEDEY